MSKSVIVIEFSWGWNSGSSYNCPQTNRLGLNWMFSSCTGELNWTFFHFLPFIKMVIAQKCKKMPLVSRSIGFYFFYPSVTTSLSCFLKVQSTVSTLSIQLKQRGLRRNADSPKSSKNVNFSICNCVHANTSEKYWVDFLYQDLNRELLTCNRLFHGRNVDSVLGFVISKDWRFKKTRIILFHLAIRNLISL